MATRTAPLPGRGAVLPARGIPSLRVCALTCGCALLFMAWAGWQQSGRGLWQDESTLLANFGLPWSTYFHALPFYDQAGPPLALMVLNATYLLADGSPVTMRLLLLTLHVAILASAAVCALRKDDRAALLGIATVATTALAVHFSLELKQYMFELQASLVFMLALRWWPDRPGAVMLLAAVLSFASFSIMLVVGVATLDAIVFRFAGSVRWRWFAALVVYSLGWLACYALLFRPAAALQMANYPTAYNRLALAAYIHESGLLLAMIVAIGKAQPVVAIAGASVAGAFIGVVRRRANGISASDLPPDARPTMWQPLRVLAGLLALIALLWLARVYPVVSSKQFLFTMPITALLLANIVIAACSLFGGGLATAAMLGAMLIPGALYTGARGLTRTSDFQDTRGLYDFVRGQRSALILPDMMFEPTLRAYAARDPHPPHRVTGWLTAESRPMETPRQVLTDLAAGDVPIAQHDWQPLITSKTYPAYVDWLVRHARGEPVAILAAAQLDPADEPVIAEVARRQDCRSSEAYRSRGVVAFRITCPAP